jgi:hypothetical protein
MDRPVYQKLKEFRAELERRSALLHSREREIVNELDVREKNFPEAVIQGRARMAPVSR